MSEELENSLQQAIESYLSERLRAIDEQLSRLHSDFSDALARVRESSSSGSLEETPVSDAISAHLKAAREQKLSGPAPVVMPGSGELAAIRRAVSEIERQDSQSNVLGALLRNAASFAERVALFVIKNDLVVGWRVCEAVDTGELEAIPSIFFALADDTVVGRAVRSRSAEMNLVGPSSHDKALVERLGGGPQAIAALPIVVRGKVVAALYADSTSPQPESINLDALETLARVAAMRVDVVSGSVPAQAQAAAQTLVAQSSAPAEVGFTSLPSYVPTVEPQEAYAEAEVEEVYDEPEVEVVAEEAVEESFAKPQYEVPWVETAEPVAEEFHAAPEQEVQFESVQDSYAVDQTSPAEESYSEPHQEFTFERVSDEVAAEPEPAVSSSFEFEHSYEDTSSEPVLEEIAAPEPEPEPVAAAPSFEPAPVAPPVVASSTAPAGVSGQYSAPLGTGRRWGANDADLPVDVGEDEKRLHNDARRFARLLVSEIKLYNEPKVKEGRSKSDIYERLRDDIDRSREMYQKRVAPPVAARHDYFHQELVNTLAEGDPAKLGSAYPGASLSAH